MNKLRNILRIALRELKTLRDVKMLVFMIATPVVLILILGTTLTNAFNGSIAVGKIRVLYTNHSHESSLMKDWEKFAEQSAHSGIEFVKASETMDAKLEVENNHYVGYVELTDSGLHYYGNSRNSVENVIAQSALASFADSYKLANGLEGLDTEQAAAIMSGSGGKYVQETSLNAARQPSAMDYYAIAMITLIIMYGSLTAAQLIDGERKRNTSVRLLVSPITKGEIFAGKIMGNLLQNVVYVTIVVLICKYMFNIYWGDRLGLVLFVLFTQVVFSLSLGLGFSYMIKGNASSSILMMIIQVGAFIGGSYFPLQDVTGILRTITRYSPLEWTNEALLQIIYADNGSAAVSATLLNLGFSMLLLIAAVMIMRRREGL